MLNKRLKTAILGLTTFLLLGLVSAMVAGGSTANADPSNVNKVRVIEYGHNAPGTDDSGDRNHEFVRLLNMTSEAINVEGWILHDTYKTGGGDWGNRYTFRASDLPSSSPFLVDGKFTIPAGGQVYVYNGAGTDTTPSNNTAAVYRNFKHHWNNGGDTIYLRDTDGTVVHWITYTSYRERIG